MDTSFGSNVEGTWLWDAMLVMIKGRLFELESDLVDWSAGEPHGERDDDDVCRPAAGHPLPGVVVPRPGAPSTVCSPVFKGPLLCMGGIGLCTECTGVCQSMSSLAKRYMA